VATSASSREGLLLAPEVEEAAFAWAVGETSQIIESDFGIHIVQVLDRDPARPLSAEIQQRLRAIAFEAWLDQLWQTATVERNI
jgi:parvulin-like peptidyl-prolyl isomerase